MKLVALLVALLASVASAAEPRTQLEMLHDPARDRDIPIKIYLPDAKGDVPLVLLSHGLGGTREALSYIAEPLAADGYLVVTLQHVGSDESVWRGVRPRDRFAAMETKTKEPQEAIERAADVSFVLDALLAHTAEWTKDLPTVNPEQIGMGGHSYGSQTTLFVSGMGLGRGLVSRKDDRIKASVALSPSNKTGTFDGIDLPMLHITGTEDTSPFSPGVGWEARREAFDTIDAPGQILMVFDGATHAGIGGNVARMGEAATSRQNVRMHELIQGAVVAFFDAHLRGDQEAAARLADLPTLVGDAGTVEMR